MATQTSAAVRRPPAPRNGYEKIRVTFTIDGDAPRETLEKIVKQSQARSAVYDLLTNGVPIELSIVAG
jgi:uncharacterized OsmC-like protein